MAASNGPALSPSGGGATSSASVFPSSTPSQQQQQAPIPSGQNPYLSPAEMRYIIEGCVSDVRSDGRSTKEFRPYGITPSSSSLDTSASTAAAALSTAAPLVLSNGSSRITLPGSDTDVLCSVRAELVIPSAERPNEGVVECNIDLLPSAVSYSGDNRRRRTEEMEISAVLTNLLLPHVVDKSALCVIPGKYVWRLAVDVLVLACDGNVVDVSALAVRAAIRATVLPTVTPVAKAGNDGGNTGGGGSNSGKVSDDFMVDGDIAKAAVPPGADQCPVVITVFVLDKERSGSVLIVDARSDEELCSATRISVSVDPDGNICGIYKHGSAPSLGDEGNYSGSLQVGRLMDVTDLAASASKKVMNMMDGGSSTNVGMEGTNVVSDDLLRSTFELR